MNARHQKVIATLTMAFAFSAVVIGSAQAAGRPDNRAGIRGIGSQNTEMSDVFTRAVARAGIASQNADMSDVFTRAVARAHAAQTVRPDDRAGIRGVGARTPTCQTSSLVPSRSHAPRRSDRTTGPASAAPAPNSSPPQRL